MLPADEMNKVRIPALIVVLGLAATARAADPTNRAPASRDYTNRVQFHSVDFDVSKPGAENQTGPGLDTNPDRPVSPDLDPLQPSVYVPVARPVPAKKKEKNWMGVPGTGSGLDKKKEKKESGWGWLADDVNSAEKKRGKKETEKDRSDQEVQEDEDTEDEQDAEDQTPDENREAARNERPQQRTVDRRYEPREAPDLYREGKGGSQDVVRADAAGQPGKFDNADAPTSLMSEGSAVANQASGQGLREYDARVLSGDAGLGDASGFAPVLSSPTVMPGESDSFQALSPSLGGQASEDSSYSLGWSSSFGDDASAPSDSSDSLRSFDSESSDSSMSFDSDASKGFGDDSGETRKSALPW
jgi:hypothetical protein